MGGFNEKNMTEKLELLKNVEVPEDSILRAKNQVMAVVRKEAAGRLNIREEKRLIPLKLKTSMPIIAIIIALVMSGGVAAAAQNDLPGDPLYGIKLATETVVEKFVWTPKAKVKFNAALAERRANELSKLKEKIQLLEDRAADAAIEATSKRLEKRIEIIEKQFDQKVPVSPGLHQRMERWEETLLEIHEIKTLPEETQTEAIELYQKIEEFEDQAIQVQETKETPPPEPPKQGLRNKAIEKVGIAEEWLILKGGMRNIVEEAARTNWVELESTFNELDVHFQTGAEEVMQARTALAEEDWQAAIEHADRAVQTFVNYAEAVIQSELSPETFNPERFEMPEGMPPEDMPDDEYFISPMEPPEASASEPGDISFDEPNEEEPRNEEDLSDEQLRQWQGMREAMQAQR